MGEVSNLDTRLLDRRMYDLPEAARFLDLPVSTLRRWLLGDVRKGVEYLPVLREQSNDDGAVKWGEFIEAAVLKTLRGDHRVNLQELRVFCHTLRNREQVPYPLAMREILLNGKKLLYPLRLANMDALVAKRNNRSLLAGTHWPWSGQSWGHSGVSLCSAAEILRCSSPATRTAEAEESGMSAA